MTENTQPESLEKQVQELLESVRNQEKSIVWNGKTYTLLEIEDGTPVSLQELLLANGSCIAIGTNRSELGNTQKLLQAVVCETGPQALKITSDGKKFLLSQYMIREKHCVL